MATGGLVQLRGANTYAGWVKQAAWHTDLAPTSFWRWMAGSSATVRPKITPIREGDTGRYVNSATKESQYGMFKIVEQLRPRTVGCGIQAFMGSGSDTYTAPANSSTLSAQMTAGATSFSSVADLGNVGASVALNFSPGVASQVYEVLLVNMASRAGTGPYTYTLVAGQSAKFTHPSSDPVSKVSTHAFTPSLTGYDPYTVEIGRGDGSNAPFQVERRVDAVCYGWKLTSSKGGKVVLVEHDWYNAREKLITGNATPVYEGVGQVGLAGGPMTHAMATGNWSINGVTTGNALTVESCVITAKNTTNPEEWVSENTYPDNFTLDNFDVSVDLTVIFQTFTDYYNTYYNGVSTANTQDSNLVGYGSFTTTWTEDGVNGLVANLPYAFYTAADIPFSTDNKPVRQQIRMTGLKNAANPNPLLLTLTNSQNSQY